MKIYRDIPLTQFEFWAGANPTASNASVVEATGIELILEDLSAGKSF